MPDEKPTLDKATTYELVVEFMSRDCHTRRAALRDELDRMDVYDLMEIFDIEESEGSNDGYQDGYDEGREKGAKTEREKLISLTGELAFSVSPEAQQKLRDYLYLEHGITNVYAARMG